RRREDLERRLASLDDRLETTQGQSEALQDENGRLKGMLKKAQDEREQLKRQLATLEDRFKSEEQTLVRDLEVIKKTKVEEEQRLTNELASAVQEREQLRGQFNELKRKAHANKRKFDEATQGAKTEGEKLGAQLQALKEELH